MSLPIALSAALLITLVQGQTTSSSSSSASVDAIYTPPPPVGNANLAPVSYSFDFTVTTATTAWGNPAFQTPAPLPPCTESMCPELNNQVCQDERNGTYGVLCDTHLGGIIITTSGMKHKRDDEGRDLEEAAMAASSLGEREAEGSLEDRDVAARDYTRTFANCVDYCNDHTGCLAVSFNIGFEGNCQMLSSIDGSFSAPGQIAAVKQGDLEPVAAVTAGSDS